MKLKASLWALVGLLAGGCAQHQVSQDGAQDFEPLPLRDTAASDPGTARSVVTLPGWKPTLLD